MKSLEELARKHAYRTSDPLNGDCTIIQYHFNPDGLESLINEVISQRLGEPLSHIDIFDKKKKAYVKTPLYALNIES